MCKSDSVRGQHMFPHEMTSHTQIDLLPSFLQGKVSQIDKSVTQT